MSCAVHGLIRGGAVHLLQAWRAVGIRALPGLGAREGALCGNWMDGAGCLKGKVDVRRERQAATGGALAATCT